MVTNWPMEKASGDWSESAKLMEEKETPPEMTSGTFEMVVLPMLQVMLSARESAMEETSAGSSSVPMMKQGLCRLVTTGAGWCELGVILDWVGFGVETYQRERHRQWRG